LRYKIWIKIFKFASLFILSISVTFYFVGIF
jgi:hypothetical protein